MEGSTLVPSALGCLSRILLCRPTGRRVDPTHLSHLLGRFTSGSHSVEWEPAPFLIIDARPIASASQERNSACRLLTNNSQSS